MNTESLESLDFPSLIKNKKINKKKIKTLDYLDSGKFPIIDQGQDFISGYTNDTSLVYDDELPVIVFGDHTLSVKFIDFPFGIGADGTKIIHSNQEKCLPKFLYYLIGAKNIQSDGYARHFSKLSQQSFLVPSIPHQNRIISILSNVDHGLEKINHMIKQTQQLKKGMMQKLLTTGINHTKIKKMDFGNKILNSSYPVNWSSRKFKDILEVNEKKIDLQDTEKYTRITVKRRNNGIILRDVVKGNKILTKNQFRVKTGQFIISRRQIIHNACGIIPKEFDNALVSNEYSIFSGTSDLDLNYFDLFSQTDFFKKTIILTTQGVHLEKYIFLLDEWLELSMPLPSFEEQQKIVSLLSNVEIKIQHYKQYQEKFQHLKKSLIQKLLNGEIKVKV
jgi:restriction endonuclease S subunit